MTEEAFFKKDKKKGLAGLLLLFVGGSKRDKLLVLVAVIAALLATSVAGMTGKLNLGGGEKKKTVTADGVVVAEEEENAKALEPEQVFQEAKQAGMEAASARKVFGGVPGKARGDKNEAVNYVSRDKKVFGTAEDQHGVDTAAEGKAYEGAAAGRSNGLTGMQGMGSLGMASAGAGGAMGGNSSFSVSNDKSKTFGELKNKMGDMPGVREPRGGGLGAKARGGKLSVVKAKDLNARVVRSSKKINLKQGKMGKAMWQLVSAAAQTLVSRCAGCAKESTLLYNRAYATGESIQGAGIISLPGDAPVAVDAGKMETMLNSFAGNTSNIGSSSAQCQEAMAKNNNEMQDLGKQIGNLRWSDGTLGQQPEKCCKVKDYNSKVGEYRDKCTKFNAKTAEVNAACGTPVDQGKMNCEQFKEVDTCGWFKCWFLFIMIVIAVIALAIVAPYVGIALAALPMGAMGAALVGGAVAGAAIVGAFQIFAPNEIPH